MRRTVGSAYDALCVLAGTVLPEREVLERATRLRELVTGDALFRVGERHPTVFAVTRGVVRLVYETPHGDSWIKGFAEPGICFASLTALQPGGVTSYSAYAELPSTVACINMQAIEELAGRHLAWQRAMANAFKLYGQRKEQREMELLTQTPQQRYLGFLQNNPGLAAILRQRDIASYVRVTPVALSRIKARLKAGKRLQ